MGKDAIGVAIIILNIDPVIRAPAERMLQLAQRHHPGLGGGGIDIAVLVVLGPTGPLCPKPLRLRCWAPAPIYLSTSHPRR